MRRLRVSIDRGDRIIVRRPAVETCLSAGFFLAIGTPILATFPIVFLGDRIGLMTYVCLLLLGVGLTARSLRPLLIILDSPTDLEDARAETLCSQDVERLDVRERHEAGRGGGAAIEVNATLADGRERLLYRRGLARRSQATLQARTLSARWRCPLGNLAIASLGVTRVRLDSDRIVVRRTIRGLFGAGLTVVFLLLMQAMAVTGVVGSFARPEATWVVLPAFAAFWAAFSVALVISLGRFLRSLRPLFILWREAPPVAKRSTRDVWAGDIAAVELRRAARISDFEGHKTHLQLVLHFSSDGQALAICEENGGTTGRESFIGLARDVQRWIGAPARGRALSFLTRPATEPSCTSQ